MTYVLMLLIFIVPLVAATNVQPAGKTTETYWSCKAVFADAAGDTIRSDTATGSTAWPRPYVDGLDGVICRINRGDPTLAHFGWLTLSTSSKSPRSLYFPGQQSGNFAYAAFYNRGTFEVKEFAQVAWTGDPDYVDVAPFRAYLTDGQFQQRTGRFRGDSNFSGSVPGGTSSVFVQPLDQCSWSVTFDPARPLLTSDRGEWPDTRVRDSNGVGSRVLELTENVNYTATRGFFPMKFAVVITVVAGKAGCPL